jgi:pimeloyl-ACP methyl ester carboxylesterase
VARLVSALVSRGALEPARAIVGFVSRERLRTEQEEILAPIWKLSPELRRPLGWMWTQPRFFEALGSQIESVCQSAADVLDAEGSLDLPVTVVSASAGQPTQVARQEALVRRSSRGRRIVASASGHWVPLDQPDVVVSAVRELLDHLQSGR